MAGFHRFRTTAPIRTDALSAEKRAAIQEGLREIDEGLGVPLDEVEAWIESWDTPDELPMPQPCVIKGLGRIVVIRIWQPGQNRHRPALL